jgi:hypothetical protein
MSPRLRDGAGRAFAEDHRELTMRDDAPESTSAL